MNAGFNLSRGDEHILELGSGGGSATLKSTTQPHLLAAKSISREAKVTAIFRTKSRGVRAVRILCGEVGEGRAF